MLQFDIEVTAANTETRTIEGVAVPYGETANLGGTTYRFERGSLKPARDRTPLLLGHDRNRPIGILTELADTETGAIARFHIDNGPEGDLALAQAASGSRGGLSIGAEIVKETYDADGVANVTEAALLEISLVAIPAFAGSSVTQVAADADEKSVQDLAAKNETPTPDPTNTTEPVQEKLDMSTTEPIAPAIIPMIIAEPRPTLNADNYVTTMVRAMKGDHNAMRVIQAELDVIDTAAIIGLVPDVYTREIIGGLSENRALAQNVRNAPMPAEGMKLYKPEWTATPVGGWIDEEDPTPSNPITIGNHEVNILQWAYGVSMTVASLERGFGVAESVFRQIILSYYAAIETKIGDAITDAAGTETAGLDLTGLGLLSAAVYQDSGRRPDKVYVSPDVWAAFLATEGSLPFTQGNTNAASIAGNIAGLDVVVSGVFDAGTMIVADSSVIELRESAPLQLRANVVGTMQVELGVTSFASFDVELVTAVKIAEPA